MDRLVFRAINAWSDSLDPVLTPLSLLSGWAYFRVAVAVILLGLICLRKTKAALLSILAVPIADGLCNVAKHQFPRLRPFQELSHVVLRVGNTDSMGTASSHAANMAAVATVMTLMLGAKWGLPWIVLAVLVGISRIYVGAHYPSQVLLGWAVGIGVGFAIDRASRIFSTKWAARRQP